MNAILLALFAPFLILFILGLMFFVDLLLAFPLMWAWNYVIPDLWPSLHALSYWQAYSLLIVSSLLIKSYSSNSSSK